MKKRWIYVFVVFVMFLSPFLILSNHFLNIVESVSVNYVISNMELGVNSISSRITSVLIEKYDILKDIRNIKNDNEIINKIKHISDNQIVKKISYFSIDGNLLYSTHNGENKKISGDYIFENAKKIDIPLGVISYPDNSPPELIMAERIGKGVVVYVTDLGYLNEIVFRLSKKNIGKIYLVDGSYNIIFDSNYEFILNEGRVTNKEIIKLIDNLKSKSIFSYKGYVDLNGKKHIITLSNVETTNWWVYNIIDYSQSMDFGLKKWAKRVIVSGIIIIVAFSYITLIIYEKFLRNKL